MGLAEWLRVFRTLHDAAKKGGLGGPDADDYRAGCDELARALMTAQRLTPRTGESPRHALRVARALQADLDTPVLHVRATTIDVFANGFSAILAKPPPANEALKCTLRAPGGEPIVCDVLTTDVKAQSGSVRVSFAFQSLGASDRERLTLLVIDTALSQLAG